MKIQLAKIAGILALVLVVAGSASAANLLINPSFETGNFTGWTVSDSLLHGVDLSGIDVPADCSGWVNVRTGSYAAYGVVSSAANPRVAITLSQTISVAPNQTFDIGFYASNWSSRGAGANIGDGPEMIAIYVNGTQILSPGFLMLDNYPPSWYNFDGSYSNGAATSLTVTFQFTASALVNSIPISLDDFYVTPEPSTLSLLGIGVVGLTGYGWRKRRM